MPARRGVERRRGDLRRNMLKSYAILRVFPARGSRPSDRFNRWRGIVAATAGFGLFRSLLKLEPSTLSREGPPLAVGSAFFTAANSATPLPARGYAPRMKHPALTTAGAGVHSPAA